MDVLDGKVAVVTGAASGIGRGMAESFVGAGMRVVLSDVEEAALHSTVAELQDGGADVRGVVADVSLAEDVTSLAETTLRERFYVLTHPEYAEHIEHRVTQILSSDDPSLLPMPAPRKE